MEIKDKIPSIVNVTPSILELFGIDWKQKCLDGEDHILDPPKR